MSDMYEALIVGTLDTSKLDTQLKDWQSKNGKVKISSDFVASSNAKSAAANMGKQAGKSFSQSFSQNALDKIKLRVDTGDFKTKINAVQSKINSLNKSTKQIDSNFAKLNESYKTLTSSKSSDEQIFSAYQKFSTILPVVKSQISAVAAKESQAAKISKAHAAEVKKFSNIQYKINIGDLQNKFDSIKSKMQSLSTVPQSLKDNYRRLYDQMNVVNSSDKSLSQRIAAYQKINYLMSVMKSEILGVEKAQLQEAAAAEQAVKSQISAAQTLEKSSILSNNITAWMNTNTKAASVFGSRLQDIQSQLANNTSATKLKTLSTEFQKIKSEAKAAGLSVNTFSISLKSIALQALGISSAYMAIQKLVNIIKSGVQTVVEMDDAMVDLKKTTTMSASELTQFYDDANESAKRLGVSTQDIIQSAADWSRLGYSDKESATQMASLAAQFKQISPGMTMDEATSGLVSTMKAYGITTNEVLDGIMSKINEVGNTAATNNTDIIEGLKNSASAMAAMGSSLDENIALFVAGQEIVNDAGKMGNGLRSIALRVRGYDEETEQLSEDLVNISGEVVDLTKTAKNAQGVSLFTDATQTHYKSIYQYLHDISDIYDDLSEKAKQQLIEKLFGKNRANIGAAIIQNMQAADKAMNTMANSAGSADREIGVASQAISYHFNSLKAVWQGIAHDVFNEKTLIGVVDVLEDISEVISSIIKTIGAAPSISGLVGALMSFGNKGFFKMASNGGLGFTLTSPLSGIMSAMSNRGTAVSFGSEYAASLEADRAALQAYVAELPTANSQTAALASTMMNASANAIAYANDMQASGMSIDQFIVKQKQLQLQSMFQGMGRSSASSMIATYNTGLANLGLTQQEFIDGIKSLNPAMAAYLTNLNGAQASMNGYRGALIATKAATIGLRIAQTALNAVIGAGIGLLISTAISGLAKLFENLKESMKPVEEKIADLDDEINSLAKDINSIVSDFRNLKSSANDIIPRYAELAQGVDKLGNNVSLTSDEYEEFCDLNNQIAEMFPELNTGMDSNGNAMLALSGTADQLTESLKNMVEMQRKAANQEIAKKLPELVEDYNKKKDLENTNAYDKNYQSQRVRELYNELVSHKKDGGIYLNDHDRTVELKDLLGIDYGTLNSAINGNTDKQEYVEDIINTFVANTEEEIGRAKYEIENAWSSVIPSITALIETDAQYNELTPDMQQVVSNMIPHINLEDIQISGDELTDSDIKNYIVTKILNPIQDATPSVQNAIKNLMLIDVKDFDSYGEYKSALDKAIKGIRDKDTENKINIDDLMDFSGNSDIKEEYDEEIRKIVDKMTESYNGDTNSRNQLRISISTHLQELNPDEIFKVFDLIKDRGIKTWEELSKVLQEEMNKSAEATKKSFTDSISEVQSLSSGFDMLDKIYADIKDGQTEEGKSFDWSSILNNNDFKDQFENLGEVYDDFIKIIANSPTDIDACQEAFNNLVTEYINGSGALNYLTDETRNATVAMLEQYGVTNAAEQIDRILAVRKEKIAQSSKIAADATWQEIAAMEKEAESGSVAQQALAQLTIEKMKVNGTKINTSDDIDAIINLANAAGSSAIALAKLEKAKSTISRLETLASNGSAAGLHYLDSAEYKEAQQILKQIESGNFNFDYQGIDANKFKVGYSGGAATSAIDYGGTSDSDNGYSEDEPSKYDWIEVLIKRIEEGLKRLKTVADNVYTTFANRNSALRKTISKTTDEIYIQQQAYSRYMQEANSVGLSSDLKAKVQDGTIDISLYSSETQELIKEYQEWYEKAIACKDAVDELNQSVADAYKQIFNNEQKKYEHKLNVGKSDIDYYTSNIDSKGGRSYSKVKGDYNGLINEYRSQADLYKKEAESLKKIRDEAVSSGNIEEGSEAWNEFTEAILDAEQAARDSINSISDAFEKMFDKISSEYDNQVSGIEHTMKLYETSINKLTNMGYMESTKFYSALQSKERESISVLKSELSSLQSALSQAVSSGEVEVYSDTWYKMKNNIDSVTEAIAEGEAKLAEYDKTMREIEWGYFDFVQERINQITNEGDFLIDLLDNNKLFDDKGKFNNDGQAVIGLHTVDYNVYMAQADKYAKEIKKIDSEIANDPYNTDLISRREELLKLQQDSIKSAESEKQAIVDLVEEGIKAELDSLNDLIDKYTDSLDAAKDLYDYQKKISEKSDEVANIKKQLLAYSNDVSEETRAKVQKLNVDLKNAEEDLQETEYERYISDTKDLLGDLYNDYEMLLNERLDDIDGLIIEMIDSTNQNSEAINATIRDTADKVGYDLSDSMREIWDNGDVKDVVSYYGDNFISYITTTNQVLANIETLVTSLVNASDNTLEKETPSTNKSTVTTTPSSSTSIKTDVPSKTTVDKSKPSATISSNKSNQSNKQIKVGGLINAGSAPIYSYVGDTNGVKQYFADDPIYEVLEELNGYLKVRWHKATQGVTGWFRKSDVKGYKTGGLVNFTGLAQLDGTPSKPEMVLNAKDTANLIELKEILKKSNLSQVSLASSINTPVITPIVNTLSDAFKEMSRGNNSYSQDITNNFNFNTNVDHVDSYSDIMNKAVTDKDFEALIQSLTTKRYLGSSSLEKSKFNNKWK